MHSAVAVVAFAAIAPVTLFAQLAETLNSPRASQVENATTAPAQSATGITRIPVSPRPPGDWEDDNGAAQPALDGCCLCPIVPFDPGWYAGAEFLLVRPQFSQAIAFSRGTLGLTSYNVQGEELDFDYDASLRAFVGYSLGRGDAAFQFTYWHLDGDVAVNAGGLAPGEFIIDPFGNGVGTVVVIDPNSAIFGQVLPAGDAIVTRAHVRTDIYDADLIKPFRLSDPCWMFMASVGLRIAEIKQHYESTITSAGSLFSQGLFDATFIGAGPRLGAEGRRRFGSDGQFSLFANTHLSLLLGQYDEVFSSATTVPGPFRAAQNASSERTISTFEVELGAAWQLSSQWSVTAGWLVQSWFDLGASGGRFGGFYVGTDDANIMSFDGMFIRAECAF
jgi:hypothetical protein